MLKYINSFKGYPITYGITELVGSVTNNTMIDRYGVSYYSFYFNGPSYIIIDIPSITTKLFSGVDINSGSAGQSLEFIFMNKDDNINIFGVRYGGNTKTITVFNESNSNISSITFDDLYLKWRYLECSFDVNNTTAAYTVRLETKVILSGVINTSPSTNNIINKVKINVLSSVSNVRTFLNMYICDDTGSKNNNFLGVTRINKHYLLQNIQQQFTPSSGTSNVALFNDAGYDTTFIMQDEPAEDIWSYDTNYNITGNVLGIQQWARHRKEDVGPDPGLKLRQCLYGSSDTKITSEQITPEVSIWKNHFFISETDPDTGLNYDIANINGMKSGVLLEE